ncbi:MULTISPECIES: hypothetical protein [unclassified Herbaspirillum]|uniref:hypothetical protein n=1 Tax=unclassified Herbaspirillum TaxID=2624150 RepID=UPI003839E113
MATQKTQAKPAVRATAAKPAVKAVVKAAVKTPAVKKPAVKKIAAKPAVVAKKPVAKAVAPALKKPLAPIARTTVKPVTKPVAKAVAKIEKKAELKLKKVKQVRDSFTMPETEYEVLGQVKKACLKAGFEIKKSDLLRIGVSLIKNLETGKLKTLLAGLTPLKVGRPKK